jgi:hypothetical protein
VRVTKKFGLSVSIAVACLLSGATLADDDGYSYGEHGHEHEHGPPVPQPLAGRSAIPFQ